MIGVAMVILANWAGVRANPPALDFNRDVRPILSDKCIACHGPDEKHRKAKLRLDDEKVAVARGAIVPGQPDDSEIILRILSDDEESRMPPAKSGKKLTPDEIVLLKRWIAEGAKYAPHWAYVPPRRHPVPVAKFKTSNYIDSFLFFRLEREGLNPAPEANPITLVRRLYFDLLGLPPTPSQAESFAANPSAEAYEKLVDQLLASPHYGERMAMYWLDLVRYADTVGYHGDQDHQASPYRDYVIDAFNDNMRFDQFTREQLAGDLLPKPTTDQLIATCYNRMLQTSHEGGVQAKEYLAIYAADRVRNVSAVWMGATMGCAQCHDHKYDPYSTRDFYSLAAFFADIDEDRHLKGGNLDTVPTKRLPEIRVFTPKERAHIAELNHLISELNPYSVDVQEQFVLKGLLEQRERLRRSKRLVMVTQATAPRTMRILPRGNWLDDSGPEVTPAVPAFLPAIDRSGRATRLDLANWLVDPERGVGKLTARVFVNRLMYLFFGDGLSKSLEDFGGQGEPPMHPELLDHLAMEFVESGWNVKHVVKLIVMSRAYRQSSLASAELRERDPENRLLARQGRWRLPAESIRDNALAVSGLLVSDVGGATAKPYQPPKYYRHLNFPPREYAPSTDSKQWRRGVYVHWQRQFLHPMLKAFDASSREECCAQRPRSNTPLAALVLLNDPTFVEAARELGRRTLAESGPTDEDRIKYAFRLATSRTPDDLEIATLNQLLAKNRAEYRSNDQAANNVTRIGLKKPSGQDEVVELAAWTAVGRALLNLSETNTRE
jgi:hypothetical protein